MRKYSRTPKISKRHISSEESNEENVNLLGANNKRFSTIDGIALGDNNRNSFSPMNISTLS